MSDSAQRRIHSETEISGAEWIDEDTTLRPGSREYIIDSSSNTVDITLPDIGESVGNVISFQAPDGASNDTSILIKETASEHASGDMDADDDYLVLFNNGLQWVVFITNVA